MRLYHASTSSIEKPDVLHSRDKLDFGRGFYLTGIREQAIRYSDRFTRRGKEAFINEYELDYELISEGVADMHCRSDEYLAEELMLEYKEKESKNSQSPQIS